MTAPASATIVVVRLDHVRPEVAAAVRGVAAAAYRAEADLIGVDDLAPLRRTAESIATAEAELFGVLVGGHLAGVAEVEARPRGPLCLASLVVLPDRHRQGLGGALVGHVLGAHPERDVEVSTAEANRPALALYGKMGFVAERRWTTRDGIPMVTLLRRARPC